tara:strand:- start:915 stop:2438 length:1524 start_codon:yes stop_codon:yes gene_type:complete
VHIAREHLLEMDLHDLYILSPELALVSLAIGLILLDIIITRKELIPIIAVIGLVLPVSFAVALWFDPEINTSAINSGVLEGTLVVDKFGLFFKFLVIAVVGLVFLSSTDHINKFPRFRTEYYALVMLSSAGMMLLASAVEFITIYVALELTALPVAALVAFGREERSAEAGLKFLILSAISSAILLYGMVIVYGFTGTTNLEDIASVFGSYRVPDTTIPFGSNAMLFGVILIIAGFGFKIAVFPFHMWAPDVYEGAPTPITAFLSVASKAAGFAVVLRVFNTALDLPIISVEWSIVFAVMSACSMTIGNLIAIRQKDIKRLLAYSTIAHAGYILVGVASIGSADGDGSGSSAVLFYLSGYAATNLAAFTVVIAISERIGSFAIDDFAGMAKRAPFLAAVLAFSMVSLIGVPPAVGFVTKVYIFGSAIESNLAWLAVVGVINSVISAYYYLRVVKVMYLSPANTEDPIQVGLSMKVAMIVSFIALLGFGLYPTPLLKLAAAAAAGIVA